MASYKHIYTVAVYNEKANGALDFRVSGSFMTMNDAIKSGNSEAEYYMSNGYYFDNNGWGDIGVKKYVWRGWRDEDFVMIIASVNALSNK